MSPNSPSGTSSLQNMFTDDQIAQVLIDQYAGSGKWDLAGSFFGVHVGVQEQEDVTLVAFRGSSTLVDWIKDALALHTVHDDGLGHLHAGFALGVGGVARMLLAELKGPVILAGHSLGAAQAAITAGYMTLAGRPPLRVVTFGQPRPGHAKLGEVLKDVPQVAYRNGDDDHHDYVTDVPYHIPLLFPYEHPVPMTKIDGGFGGSGKGLFDRHHMDLYLRGIK